MPTLCPACKAENAADAEACFTCGKALFALTQGVLLAGRYEVLMPLGRGGMGMVYKARDLVLDETVAIKVLRSEIAREPDMAKRFRSEIKLARKVSHRNVCRIHEYGEDGAVRFISMEYIEGSTLKDRLRASPPGLAEAFDFALQVTRGLQAVHEHGIIHRDFKTSNIMVDAKGVVRLMDFGIAKPAGGDTSSAGSSGGLIGTPEYMSPEQARGASLDIRSDIYSLGCVLFEIFTGNLPFPGDTPVAILFKHINSPLPPTGIAAMPDALVPVVRKALAKNPRDRYQDTLALYDGLRSARDASGAHSPGRPPVETTTLNRLRGEAQRLFPWKAWMTWAVVLVLVVGAWLMGRRLPERGPVSTPTTVAVPVTSPPSTAASVSPVKVVGDSGPSTPRPRSIRTPAVSQPSQAVPASPTLAVTPPPTQDPVPASTLAATTGVFSLVLVPEADVFIDGVSQGRVSSRQFVLEAGLHAIRVVHPEYEALQRKVTVKAGIETRLILDLAEKAVRRQP